MRFGDGYRNSRFSSTSRAYKPKERVSFWGGYPSVDPLKSPFLLCSQTLPSYDLVLQLVGLNFNALKSIPKGLQMGYTDFYEMFVFDTKMSDIRLVSKMSLKPPIMSFCVGE